MSLLLATASYAKSIDENIYKIEIPKQSLIRSLNFLSNQTETLILFDYDLVENIMGNAVYGRFSAEEALNLLVKNSGLAGGVSESGVLTISKYNKENSSMKYQKTVLSAAVSLLASGGNAVAQETENGAAKRQTFLEEVVVTAQKREQNANDIGMAITAVNGEAFAQLGIANTEDLANIVPGFTFADTGFTVPVYSIRGVGFNEQSVQATSTVGVYNDQVAVPFPIMSAGLQLDVQRVEVLKGPQGTLYGRNSTGGAVNYIANRAGDEFEASVGLEYSTFDTIDVSGILSGPLSDSVGARLAVRSLQSGEGWQESVTTDDTLGEQDRFAARLLLDIAASDSLDIGLALNYWTDNSDTQAPQYWRSDNQRPDRTILVGFFDESEWARIPLLGTDDNQAADWTQGNNRLNRPEADMTSTSFTATVSYAINDDLTLTSLSAYNGFDNNSSYDNSGWAGMPLDATFNGVSARDTISPVVRGLYDDFDTLGSIGYTNDAQIDAFSQELRLSGDTDTMNWLVGVYFSDEEVESNTPQLVEFNTSTNLGHLFGVGLQGVENPTEQQSQSWAVFAHTEWQLSDVVNLTAGMRYTEDKKDFQGCTADNGDGDLANFFNTFAGAEIYAAGGCAMTSQGLPQTEPFVGELNEDSVSWRLGIDYIVNDNNLLYASYSRGFKSGSFPTLTSDRWDSFTPVTQEQVDAYEIGAKSQLLDGNMQINTAAFYYDYTDKQLFSKLINEFGAANALASVPSSNVYGAELDVLFSPIQGLIFNTGISYVQTEVEEFQGFSQVGLEGDFRGSEFPLTPEIQAFAMANYEFSLSENLKGFGMLNVSYSAESYSDYSISEVLDTGSNGSRYPVLLQRYGVNVGDSLDVMEEFVLPSHTLIGARFGIAAQDDSWTVSVWGRNLTDEYVVNNTRKSSDAILAYTGMPRTVGIALNVNW